MSRVIILSKHFLKGHPKEGQPTNFKEKFLSGEKKHTIRNPKKKWKVGDKASIREWSGKPYRSKQIIIKEVEIKKVWDIKINFNLLEYKLSFEINNKRVPFNERHHIWENDGLDSVDFWCWFVKNPTQDHHMMQEFKGQIICWDESVEY